MKARWCLCLLLALVLPGPAFAELFTYDGDTLLVETGLNFSDQPIWWRQIITGPSGLADAPQMRIEQQVGPPLVFAVIHDEQGSVIGIASDDCAPQKLNAWSSETVFRGCGRAAKVIGN